MEITFSDNQGTTESMNRLRKNIIDALANGNNVVVNLLQPGVMYENNNVWRTVVDFMNEWQGMAVAFRSNLVPLKNVMLLSNTQMTCSSLDLGCIKKIQSAKNY